VEQELRQLVLEHDDLAGHDLSAVEVEEDGEAEVSNVELAMIDDDVDTSGPGGVGRGLAN
jgi:hypothetical protein